MMIKKIVLGGIGVILSWVMVLTSPAFANNDKLCPVTFNVFNYSQFKSVQLAIMQGDRLMGEQWIDQGHKATYRVSFDFKNSKIDFDSKEPPCTSTFNVKIFKGPTYNQISIAINQSDLWDQLDRLLKSSRVEGSIFHVEGIDF